MTSKAFPVFGLVGLLATLPLPFAPLSAGDAKPVKPVPLAFNTADDEDEPHAADNGLTLYYTATVKGKEELMAARRKAAGQPWPAKGELVEGYVSTPADDRSAFATTGAFPQYLFFATKKDKEQKNYDLYVAVKQDRDKVWSAPTPLSAIDTDEDELHPWLSADGKTLWFSRKTKDGWRVFTSTRKGGSVTGGWGEPAVLEDLPADFHHATLTPDGKSMYLQGPLDKGRWGLFVSTRGPKAWGKPAALEELNDPDGKTGDRSPNLSRDGRYLYFASDRPGGKGGLDAYAVSTGALKKR